MKLIQFLFILCIAFYSTNAFSCSGKSSGTYCDPENPCKIAYCSNGALTYTACTSGLYCAGTAPNVYCDWAPQGFNCNPVVATTGLGTTGTTARVTTGTTGVRATTGTTGIRATTGTTGRVTTGTTGVRATTGTTGRVTTGTTGIRATTGTTGTTAAPATTGTPATTATTGAAATTGTQIPSTTGMGTTTGTGPVNPGSYQCNVQECASKNTPGNINCRCAAGGVPGAFPASDHPMFITVTFDDAFLDSYIGLSEAYFGNPTAFDAAGCTPKGTFFISNDYTIYHSAQVAQKLYGAELAVHTITHTTRSSYNDWYKEIVWGRKYTAELTNTPESEIVGFRFPYLTVSNQALYTLGNNGFWYDSSIADLYNTGVSTATDMTWPYTLDYGSPQPCNVGECPAKVPGLWEIPMSNLYDTNNQLINLMDPSATGLYEILMQNFLRHYNGNRSPLGVYMHYKPENAAVLRRFWDTISRNYTGVFFVTNKQLIQWMKNPTNIAGTIDRFRCSSSTPTPVPEVCDGIDNDNDGIIDNGIQKRCAYPNAASPSYSFTTCATGGCYCAAPSFTQDPFTATRGCDVAGGGSSYCLFKADGSYCDPAYPCRITMCSARTTNLMSCSAGLMCQTISSSSATCNWAPVGYVCPN